MADLIEKNAVFELIRSFPNVDRQLPIEFMKALYELPTIITAKDDAIENLPSAQKTGKWIEREDPFGFFDTIPVCSECGHTTKMRERYNYCPNCGADMRGDKK